MIKFAFVAAFALVAGYGVYTAQTQTDLSDIALDNVEALATPEKTPPCKGYGDVLCSYNNVWVYEQK